VANVLRAIGSPHWTIFRNWLIRDAACVAYALPAKAESTRVSASAKAIKLTTTTMTINRVAHRRTQI
jgi:hypothetical protein